MLAEPWDVLVVQEHAQDLGRPDGSGQHVMGLGVFEEGMYPAAVLRRTGTAATGTDRQGPAWHSRHDLLHPQVKAPPGSEVVAVGESFGWPQAKIPQPNPSRVSIEAGTTDIADAVLPTLDDEDVPRFGGHRDELAGLLPLLGVDRFDRRTLNRVLAAHAATETRAA